MTSAGGGPLNLLGRAYGAAAMARRRWYARHPEAVRRLACPVISVGNLRVGGSGKTPLVTSIARLLVERGERPAILSRGYARARREDGVVVVHDGDRLLADLSRTGDEPLMLARQLECVAVLASADRHLAGVLAERRLGCTVHLLDDGFQHFALHRDVNLLLVSPDELNDPRTLPAGRLREPLSAAAAADAIIVTDAGAGEARDRLEQWAATIADARSGQLHMFHARRIEAAPVLLEAPGGAALPGGHAQVAVTPSAETRVLALAAIARPDRFFGALRESGWDVVAELAFRDHHPYGPRDVARIVDAARQACATLILTTDKDLVRLLPFAPLPMPVAAAGLAVVVDEAAEFARWLLSSLSDARRARGATGLVAVPGA